MKLTFLGTGTSFGVPVVGHLRSAGQTTTCRFITRATGGIRTTATITTVTTIGMRVFPPTTTGMCTTIIGHRRITSAMATIGVRVTVAARVLQPKVSGTTTIRRAAETSIVRVVAPGRIIRTGTGHRVTGIVRVTLEMIVVRESRLTMIDRAFGRILIVDQQSAFAIARTATAFVPTVVITHVAAAAPTGND